ncbi:MAG: hypothetical protein ACRC2T_18540 [Thermoguttaceae bacterium]
MAENWNHPWTAERELHWKYTLWATFCLYWAFIPMHVFVLGYAIAVGAQLPLGQIIEVVVFEMLPFLCLIFGICGNLRLARWSCTWMAIASINLALYYIGMRMRTDSNVSFRGLLFELIILGFLLGLSFRTFYLTGIRTYWLQWKATGEHATFLPSMGLACCLYIASFMIRPIF